MQIRIRSSFALAGILMMIQGLMFAAPGVANVETVVTGTEMEAAMAARADEDAAARETILNVLERDEARAAAGQVGVDLERVKASVSLLSGEELRELAAQVGLADQSLSGGDEKIVIGSTVLIIILLVVIILVAD
jgi:hypothetical protein